MRISRKQLVKIINEELTRAGFKTLEEAPAYKPSGLFKKTDLFDDGTTPFDDEDNHEDIPDPWVDYATDYSHGGTTFDPEHFPLIDRDSMPVDLDDPWAVDDTQH